MVSFSDPDYRCRQADDDLRSAKCFNRNNMSVIEAMKTEIECGWSSSCRTNGFVVFVAICTVFISFIS